VERRRLEILEISGLPFLSDPSSPVIRSTKPLRRCRQQAERGSSGFRCENGAASLRIAPALVVMVRWNRAAYYGASVLGLLPGSRWRSPRIVRKPPGSYRHFIRLPDLFGKHFGEAFDAPFAAA